jgi:membrane AbrB-like protein
MALVLSRFRDVFRSQASVQWVCLLVTSAVFVAILQALHLPAALLLGPMLAGIVVGTSGGHIRISDLIFSGTQAIIGCMIGRAIPVSILHEAWIAWPVFVVGVMSTIIMAALLGWSLAHWRVLPGTSAIWGSTPGGAAAMVVMAAAYGADMRLVAYMQYLRVLCVTSVASLVASASGRAHPAVAAVWFPPVDWPALAGTLVVAALGVAAAKALRFRAGALHLPLIAAGILTNTGMLHIELPPWLLATAYALLGSAIGLRFTREIVRHAARAFPRVLAAIMVLIAACAGVAMILVNAAGVDPLTAYLATSPGGLDTVAIIASSSNVDVAFVLSMQFVRVIIVLGIGPWLARFLAGRAEQVRSA